MCHEGFGGEVRRPVFSGKHVFDHPEDGRLQVPIALVGNILPGLNLGVAQDLEQRGASVGKLEHADDLPHVERESALSIALSKSAALGSISTIFSWAAWWAAFNSSFSLTVTSRLSSACT